MNDEFKAAKQKLEAKKRIKELKEKAKREEAYLKMGIEPFEAVWARKQKEQEAEYAAVPLETKQKFLDYMAEGKTVGEARDLTGISLDVACKIIIKNKESYEIFPRKAKI
jgi:hypothetical protein